MNGRLTVCRMSCQTVYTGARRRLVCVLDGRGRRGKVMIQVDLFERNSSFSRMTLSNYCKVIPIEWSSRRYL